VSGYEDQERTTAWIRLRGTPDDPESWDLATWNGVVWLVRRVLPNGRRVTLEVRDYLVLERLSPELEPRQLYREGDRGPGTGDR
jgi:hypothetical protein